MARLILQQRSVHLVLNVMVFISDHLPTTHTLHSGDKTALIDKFGAEFQTHLDS